MLRQGEDAPAPIAFGVSIKDAARLRPGDTLPAATGPVALGYRSGGRPRSRAGRALVGPADGGIRGAVARPVSFPRALCESQRPSLVGWQREQWFACDVNRVLQGCDGVALQCLTWCSVLGERLTHAARCWADHAHEPYVPSVSPSRAICTRIHAPSPLLMLFHAPAQAAAILQLLC